MNKGRYCPIDYSIDRFDELILNQSVLIVGGLYGNPFALDAVAELAKSSNSEVIFNGDFHWFDNQPDDFMYVQSFVDNHFALRGNVEAELVRNSNEAGCGCAYPDYVSDTVVNRSNMIHGILKEMVKSYQIDCEPFNKLPKALELSLGEVRVLILHGDEKEIAGWSFSYESLLETDRQAEVKQLMDANNFDLIVSTHTCSPVFAQLGDYHVINNGASGMGNLSLRDHGLITYIGMDEDFAKELEVYRLKIKDKFVKVLRLQYDHQAFVEWFDQSWPEDSPASLSYRKRIVNGLDQSLNDVMIISD